MENDKKIKKERILSVMAGSLAGVINGLFGGGGGMIVVPFLTLLLNRNSQRAHATAILIILPLSIISALFYASFGSFDVGIGLPVLVGVVCGGVLGAFLLKKLSSKWVTGIFSIVMLAAGVKMLFF